MEQSSYFLNREMHVLLKIYLGEKIFKFMEEGQNGVL